MKNNLPLTVVLVIVFTTAGFFGGMKYQQSQSPSFNRQANGQRQGDRTGQGGQMNRNGFRPVNGEIISTDDKTITVKMNDGSSKIVLISDKTEINTSAQAQKTDLSVGAKVAVFGTDNSDGSVTAQNIQLNPQQFRNLATSPTPTPIVK